MQATDCAANTQDEAIKRAIKAESEIKLLPEPIRRSLKLFAAAFQSAGLTSDKQHDRNKEKKKKTAEKSQKTKEKQLKLWISV